MLFDSTCVACSARRGPVCSECASQLVPAGAMEIEGIDAVVAAYSLDERARTIVAAMKYRRERRIAGWFAHVAAGLVPRAADVITWVPATPQRRRSRGFDQAEEFARALGRATDVPARRLLRRGANDQRQTGQSRADRLNGPAVAARGASPRFVVLVDDVVTTGSSLRVAATQLRRAGATRVVAVAMATTPARRDFSLQDLTTGCSVHEWT